jgi:branched-subunit amino acid ABC-type transport system permease component
LNLELIVQLAIGGLSMGAIYALIGVGFVIVIAATNLLNFAQGELVMVGAFLGMILYVNLGWPFIVALLSAVLLTGLLGMAMELLAFRPLWARGAPAINVALASVALSILLSNGALRLAGGQPYPFPSIFGNRPVHVGGLSIVPQDLVILCSAGVVMAVLQLFFRYTQAGIALRAVMTDRETAELMGVDVRRVISLTFGISASLGAVSGVLVAPIIFVGWDMGVIGIKAFAAATLGGLKSIPGATVGGLLLGVGEQLVAAGISSAYRDSLVLALLIVVLLARPEGLFGRR